MKKLTSCTILRRFALFPRMVDFVCLCGAVCEWKPCRCSFMYVVSGYFLFTKAQVLAAPTNSTKPMGVIFRCMRGFHLISGLTDIPSSCRRLDAPTNAIGLSAVFQTFVTIYTRLGRRKQISNYSIFPWQVLEPKCQKVSKHFRIVTWHIQSIVSERSYLWMWISWHVTLTTEHIECEFVSTCIGRSCFVNVNDKVGFWTCSLISVSERLLLVGGCARYGLERALFCQATTARSRLIEPSTIFLAARCFAQGYKTTQRWVRSSLLPHPRMAGWSLIFLIIIFLQVKYRWPTEKYR